MAGEGGGLVIVRLSREFIYFTFSSYNSLLSITIGLKE